MQMYLYKYVVSDVKEAKEGDMDEKTRGSR